MATMVPAGNQINLAVQFLKPNGQPGIVDGIPVWASADETFFTLVDTAADGLASKGRHMGNETAAGQVVQLTCTADADLGTGVRPVVAMIELEAGAAEVTTAVITPGALEPIPTP